MNKDTSSSSSTTAASGQVALADISLSRDLFMRDLIRELAGTLEDVVGIEEASGYISVVGQTIGSNINQAYRRALSVDRLDKSQVAKVLVDLKRRINGTFHIVEETDDRIVLRNGHCPFGDKVIGRKSMCMMTSNVFGHIAAQNLGYAKVELKKTIAEGHDGCLIIVHLRTAGSEDAPGREYVAC